MLGVNYKVAAIEQREILGKICQKYLDPKKIIHANHNFVLLNTCNRIEIYFSSPNLAESHSYILRLFREEIDHPFDQQIYSFFGYDCFLHLSRVTAGLDSAILGETEIQGQVRESYEFACKHSSLPKELHFIFQKALHVAKHVRHHQFLSASSISLEFSLWKLCAELNLPYPKILFIGASQINLKLMEYFKKRNFGKLTLCNRTDETALYLAPTYSADVLLWEKLANWSLYDVVVCATKANYLLISEVQQYKHTTLMFDLAVPRNISSEFSHVATLYDIDRLQSIVRKEQILLENSVSEAESFVVNSTHQHLQSWQRRDLFRKQLAYA